MVGSDSCPLDRPSEVKAIEFSLDLFVPATFLALIILTANDVDSIEPVETYIVLLLMFGSYLALVPIYLWRLLTACDPYWDPTRWPIVRDSALTNNMGLVLLIGVLVFQYWFWFHRVPDLDHYQCQQYGFLLGQVRLNSKVSVVLNALMYFWLGNICLYLLGLKTLRMFGFPDPSEQRERRVISSNRKRRHIERLQTIDTWMRIITAMLVTLATELAVSWNDIRNANTLAGAGNTIPLFIGIGAVLRVLYVSAFYEDESGRNGDRNSSRGPRAKPNRSLPRPLGDRDMVIEQRRIPIRRGDRPVPVRRMPRFFEHTGKTPC